jgi:hypothetical protein
MRTAGNVTAVAVLAATSSNGAGVDTGLSGPLSEHDTKANASAT